MNYTTHSFNVGMAIKLGLESAILFQHFFYWYQNNKDNKDMFKDGRVWCFTSRKTINSIFPYLSEQKIRTAIDKLINGGYLLKGDYNKDSFKKASWYSLTDMSLAIFGELTNPLVKSTNHWLNQPQNNNNINNNNILKEKENKEKEKIENREKAFTEKVMAYSTKYPVQMLDSFVNYWTQKLSDNSDKMLFESQKAFEIGKRLATWASKDYNKDLALQAPIAPQRKKKTPWEEMGMTREEYNEFINR